MNNPELGTKQSCPECGARFYDLNNSPAHCPKCNFDFVPEPLLKPRKARKEEDEEVEKDANEEKPEQETTLETADEENKEPESKRKAALDEDESDSDELADIDDLGVDLDDDDDAQDDSLLDDDDDAAEDVSDIVKPTGEDD